MRTTRSPAVTGRPRRTILLASVGACAFLIVALAAWLFKPISTAPFPDVGRGDAAKSIAIVERWPINGFDQSVIIRGKSISNPALIWVGDLWCETPVLRHFNAALEAHFVVVYWCQRYSGQSLDPFAAPPKTLRLDQYVADLGVLIDGVRTRLRTHKVVLIGHSSGTAIGLIYAQRHPEHIAAYVGVGQIVNQAEGANRSYSFAMAAARARHNDQATKELEQIGPPPYVDGRSGAILQKWAIRFGGAFHGKLGYPTLALIGLTAREANWRDIFAFLRGDQYTAAMAPEMSALDFDHREWKFQVPVYLISGRYDHRTDGALAEAFLDRVEAPKKGFVWFDRSAHSPPFEEPSAFNAWITDNIRPLATAPRP